MGDNSIPQLNLFGISHHGTPVDFTTNPFFNGYTTNDNVSSELNARTQTAWRARHGSNHDLLDYHNFSIPEQAALKTMGISQRDTLAVNLHNNSVSNHFPVIRQSKDPFGPSVWAYPMVGQSPVDKEAEKFLASWQNLDPSLFPTDKNFRALLFQMVGEQFFLNCCLRKLAPILSSVVNNLKAADPNDSRTTALAHVDDNIFAITEIAKTHSLLLVNMKNAFKYKEDALWTDFSSIIENRRQEYVFENNKVVKAFSPYSGLFIDPVQQETSLQNKKLLRLRAQKRKRTNAISDQRSDPPPPTYICHTCGKGGHWRKHCPQNKNQGSVPKPTIIPDSKN